MCIGTVSYENVARKYYSRFGWTEKMHSISKVYSITMAENPFHEPTQKTCIITQNKIKQTGSIIFWKFLVHSTGTGMVSSETSLAKIIFKSVNFYPMLKDINASLKSILAYHSQIGHLPLKSEQTSYSPNTALL